MIERMVEILIHIGMLLLLPPLLLGVINRVKARFAGRQGPPLLQPYYDLLRLMRKGLVISRTTTWVFRAGPMVSLAAVVLAGLLVPFGPFAAPVTFSGDLILFAYLFGLARFFTTSAALDTGSAFEGMGAAREVTFACLAEPALFLGFLVLVKLSGALSLTPMFHAPASAPLGGLNVAAVVLVAIGLFIVLLAENCRIPVDDPNTHLELTMIHEVMVLDHSGPLLGMILYGSAVKLLVLAALIGHVIVPYDIQLPGAGMEAWSAALNWGLFVGVVVALAAVVGVVESVMARLQMRHVPTLLVAACLLCGLGFLMVLR
jgi:formate hydrogenlyase subunit 4